jgi:YD repeat-containing protein
MIFWMLARRALTTYDPAGLVLGTQEDAWETSGTQTVRHTTEQRNSYDDVGRQVKIERRVDAGAWRTTGQTVYATFVGGRSVTQIDSAGNKSITLTDDVGRTVEERVEGVKGAKRWTRYYYDQYGRRNLVRDSRGLQTSSEFDAAGREVQTTVLAEGRNYITRKGYDAAGRLVWQQDPQQAATTDTAHLNGFYTTYLYKIDKTENITTRITPWTELDDVSNEEDRTYGQLVQTFHEDDNQSPTDNVNYGNSHYYERYAYDAQGRQTGVIKPATITTTTGTFTTALLTRTEYDDQGRMAAMIFNSRDGQNATSTTNVRFGFAYDAKGNRSKVIFPSGIEKTWKYEYEAGTDQLKRLTESQPGSAGAAPIFKDTIYDAQGRVASVTNGNGKREDDIYDINGQLVRKLYRASGMSDPVLNVMFGYDADGRQTSVKQSKNSGTGGDLYRETVAYDAQSGQSEKIGRIK